MNESEYAEWLEKRRGYLGGTDISAIMHLNPWKSEHDVYLEKCNLVEPRAPTLAMRRGILLEPYIAQLYTETTGEEVVKSNTYLHPRYDFLGVNPDYELVNDDNRLLECKTANQFMTREWGEEGTDEAPIQYVIQTMWQMHITGRKVCDIGVLFSGMDFRIYTVQYDEDLGNALQEKAIEFWTNHVVPRIEPPISGFESDKEWLSSKYQFDTGGTIQATPEIEELCNQLIEIRKKEKEVEFEKNLIENQIKEYMGENAYLMTGMGLFSWKRSKESISVDWKSLSAELSQDLIDKYATTRPGIRRFTVPFAGRDLQWGMK